MKQTQQATSITSPTWLRLQANTTYRLQQQSHRSIMYAHQQSTRTLGRRANSKIKHYKTLDGKRRTFFRCAQCAHRPRC